ncbi:MAG: hypothetical protein H8D45_10495 [Bacteroidetes bacterium]|nr:hypothetical protein [Bacteroidota bacterium]MBL7104088.1 hypothetical protein [Bacteroidales bacterium]
MIRYQIFKYAGLAAGALAALLILAGIIGFFSGVFLNVNNFFNYFWFANTFLFFAIFCMLVFIGGKNKEEK